MYDRQSRTTAQPSSLNEMVDGGSNDFFGACHFVGAAFTVRMSDRIYLPAHLLATNPYRKIFTYFCLMVSIMVESRAAALVLSGQDFFKSPMNFICLVCALWSVGMLALPVHLFSAISFCYRT